MKLVIQIPAFNEEAALPAALAALSRKIAGFSEVAVLVVDDGSTDRTSEVARAGGADRIVRLPAHRGLAAAFSIGLEEALTMGADVIVNFDADLQYDPADIPALVEPVLAGRADLVVGDRRAGKLAHFSPGKRLLQRIGSWVVRQASGLEVPDAASGFRALSREAARRVNVFSRMTYTLETLIQAGSKDLRVARGTISLVLLHGAEPGRPCPVAHSCRGPDRRRGADVSDRAPRRPGRNQSDSPRRVEAAGPGSRKPEAGSREDRRLSFRRTTGYRLPA